MSIAVAAARIARDQSERLGNHLRALELVVAAWSSADSEGRYHLERVAQWVIGQLGARHDPSTLPARLGLPEPLDGALLERVRFLEGQPTSEVASDTGLSSASVLLLDGEASGEAFVAALSLAGSADGRARVPLAAGASFCAAVRDAETAVLRLLASRQQLVPARVTPVALTLDVDGQAVIADGASIGAAAALLYYAAYSGAPPPPPVAVSGAVNADGSIGTIVGAEAKVRAARRERPRSTKIVLPADAAEQFNVSRESSDDDDFAELLGNESSPAIEVDDADLVPVVGASTLEELIAAVYGASALEQATAGAVDVESSVARGVALFEKHGDSAAASVVLEGALGAIQAQRSQRRDPSLWRLEELMCRWRIGSAMVHAGRVRDAGKALREARTLSERLWLENAVDPAVYLGLRNSLAVLWRDSFRYPQARALLEETLELQETLRQSKREMAKTLGNLGELLTMMGRFDEARSMLERSLEYLRETYPDEVPRARYYLGNLALRAGDLDGAEAVYRAGLAENSDVTHGRDANAAFLGYGLTRALRASGDNDAAVATASAAIEQLPTHEPYPRQLILKERGLAHHALAEHEAAERDLLAAADTRYIDGALLQFGAATADAELALLLLDSVLSALERDDPIDAQSEAITQRVEAAAEYAERVAAAMAATPGLEYDPTPRQIREAATQRVEAARDGSLAEALGQAIAKFPY